MDRSPGFGSMACNSFVLLTLGFPLAPLLNSLTMLHTITRRTILQKVPHRPAGLCVLVNTRFQVLFHSPPGVLFTFPSQYCSTIGHQVVFRLGGWSPHLPTGFLVSGGTLEPLAALCLRPRVCHPLWMAFPYHYARLLAWLVAARTPQLKTGFGLFRFRSPLLTESRLISFPLGT